MITVMAQAALPTARAIRWRPLVVLAMVSLLAALASRDPQRPADAVVAVIAAALASGAVAALHDPVEPFLAALPVSLRPRRAVRIVLLVAPMLVVWWMVDGLTETTAGTGPGPLLALASAGTAVAMWAPGRRAVLLGACAPVAWMALDRLYTGGGSTAEVLAWWRTEAWLVAAAAVLACAARRPR